MKTILILAAAAAASLATAFPAAPAVAQASEASRVVVGYADLDLSSAAGIRILDRRIRSAVELACGPTSVLDPAGKNAVLQCRAETLAAARAQRDTAIAAATGATQVQLASQR